ncbi:S8 family serine peptidase [Lentzea jiangxiensis]|uniref:Peptidase inhibitor I9 n=1 Tax=Lentzea jiangxiensis TaxID=641025 RepID=A0A1H0IFF9_9PSEU|nr:S8 family serine peptidase [Lentzea jiangxiensis]SDO30219.1 Peptidase inhibitor I9 [Lentzea jiangxiensis]
MANSLRRRAFRVSLLAVVAASGVAGLSTPAQAEPGESAAILHAAPGQTVVKDRFVVVFKDTTVGTAAVRTTADNLLRAHGGHLRHTYDSALRGFSADMTEQAAQAVAKNPNVAFVQQAYEVKALDTQTNATWGLDRVDQRDRPLNGTFTYPANPGQGVRVVVIDTGINASHAEFTGRVAAGYDFVDNDSNPSDCNGHGTHVAGTAAGRTYGLAKAATISAVRVLNCQGSGSNDDIIAGINWVKNNAPRPAVVNYSIGCSQRCSDPATDQAVKDLIASGVQFVQAAGNSNDDTCYYSPQYVSAAITVGNSTSTDTRSSSSNWGSCVDIFAPGTSITSAWHTGTTATNTITGTSMASPHVAGAAAIYLGQNRAATPAQVHGALVNNASTNKLTGINTGSPNRLLHTAFMNGTTPSPTCPAVTSTTDVTIPDNTTVHSNIGISCTGNASAGSTVTVDIVHTYRGDLVIDLVAPDGSTYRLKNSSDSDSADNVSGTATVDLSGEARSGTWRLRVQDIATGDTGYINSWTLQL